MWEAAGLRCIKQVGGIPKAELEAVLCAAKEVNQKNSDGQFAGVQWILLESISVSECYVRISEFNVLRFLIFPCFCHFLHQSFLPGAGVSNPAIC